MSANKRSLEKSDSALFVFTEFGETWLVLERTWNSRGQVTVEMVFQRGMKEVLFRRSFTVPLDDRPREHYQFTPSDQLQRAQDVICQVDIRSGITPGTVEEQCTFLEAKTEISVLLRHRPNGFVLELTSTQGQKRASFGLSIFTSDLPAQPDTVLCRTVGQVEFEY